jgi:hypothetical protein
MNTRQGLFVRRVEEASICFACVVADQLDVRLKFVPVVRVRGSTMISILCFNKEGRFFSR